MKTEELLSFVESIDLEEFILFFKSHGTQTILEHYGIKNSKDLYKIRNYLNITLTEEELKKKDAIAVRESCQRKYGVDNPFQLESVKEHIVATNLERYGVTCTLHADGIKEKVTQTFIEKYGVDHPSKLKENRQRAFAKAKQTVLEKYGVEHTSQLESVRDKGIETRKRNHTCTTSSEEENFYKLCCEKFSAEDVFRQYKEVRYPFHCDFYIKSIDTFIELNLTWTHGWRPWDSNEEINQQQLLKWKQKAETSKYYAGAIVSWTERDPLKFSYAEKNNLRYFAFYKEADAIAWFNNIDEYIASLAISEIEDTQLHVVAS